MVASSSAIKDFTNGPFFDLICFLICSLNLLAVSPTIIISFIIGYSINFIKRVPSETETLISSKICRI